MRKIVLVLVIGLGILSVAKAQEKKKIDSVDKSQIKYLPDVTIVGRNSKSDYQQMPEIVGTNIYAGKKKCINSVR